MSFVPGSDIISQIFSLIFYVVFIFVVIVVIRLYHAIQKIEQKLGIAPENIIDIKIPSKILVAFASVFLVFSIIALILAINAFIVGNEVVAGYLMIIGFIGVALSTTVMYFRFRAISVATPQVSPSPQVTMKKAETTQPAPEPVLTKQPSIVYCRYCGKENKNDAVFCKNCGKNISE